MFPVISVVGWHNVGKTTLVEELVALLKASGLVVATIKHAHLAPSLDQPGTDTYRYAEAGSDLVGLVSHDLMTVESRTHGPTGLAQVLAQVPGDTDIVIVEGYKRSSLPKLEVCEGGRPKPIGHAPELMVVVERGGSATQDAERVLQELRDRGFIDIHTSHNQEHLP